MFKLTSWFWLWLDFCSSNISAAPCSVSLSGCHVCFSAHHVMLTLYMGPASQTDSQTIPPIGLCHNNIIIAHFFAPQLKYLFSWQWLTVLEMFSPECFSRGRQCLSLTQSSEASAGVRGSHQAACSQDKNSADRSKVSHSPKPFSVHPRIAGPCRWDDDLLV